jgi:hypothetical protein
VEKKLQCNDIAISALHEALDDKTFEQVKNIEVDHDAWAKLEETFEGTKTAKAYILQEKFSSFKMQEDESVPEMFHRLQVIINELKALGEEVKDNQFSIEKMMRRRSWSRRRRKKVRRRVMRRRRRVWHSKPPHIRASPRLNHQVMKTQALVIIMTLMRRWLSLSSNLVNS